MRPSQLIDTRPVWVEPDPIPADSGWGALDRNQLVAAILYRRGARTTDDARAFLDPLSLPPADPYYLPNMRDAVARIARAIANRERVAIFGDYDVDGVTSAAIMTLALTAALGPGMVTTRLPERSEGYGINPAAIAEFRAAGASLVIAVDCGSSDIEHAAQVTAAGMDLVIFDHHQMPEAGPPGAITVSPQLNGDGTYHDLTAAGVAWLAVSALAGSGIRVTRDEPSTPDEYLDLAALGTVADVAPLVGVNRRIVAGGTERMRLHPRPGLAALFTSAGIPGSAVSATDISFALAPRLNAAGRLDTPRLAFDLLLATNAGDARQLATLLERLNVKRKTRTAQLMDEAYAQIRRQPGWESRPVFALHNDGWESGLVGAVASRLVEEVRRPVFLFHREQEMLHGSARSIEGLNLVSALRGIETSLTRFGGHSLAVGVTLPEANLPELEAHLAQVIATEGIEIPAPRRLVIDARLPAAFVSLETVREIARLEPFGRGNEQPLLHVAGAELMRYGTIGQDRSHLKLNVRCNGRQFEAIAWGTAARSRELVGARGVDLVGRLEINRWNGNERLQMVLADFRPA